MPGQSFREDKPFRYAGVAIGVVFLAIVLARAVVFYRYGETSVYSLLTMFFVVALVAFLAWGLEFRRRSRRCYRRAVRSYANPLLNFVVTKPRATAQIFGLVIVAALVGAHFAFAGLMQNARVMLLLTTSGGMALGLSLFVILFYLYRREQDN